MNHRRRVVKPGDIKTRALTLFWDESEGNLFTALAVSGMKMARAWPGLCNGTGELLDTMWVSVDWDRNPAGDRQVAHPRVVEYRVRVKGGGTSRSSGEGFVMGLERRGRAVGSCPVINHMWEESRG